MMSVCGLSTGSGMNVGPAADKIHGQRYERRVRYG